MDSYVSSCQVDWSEELFNNSKHWINVNEQGFPPPPTLTLLAPQVPGLQLEMFPHMNSEIMN